MDIKNVQSNKVLLPRKEVRIVMAYDGSVPNRKQLKKLVADKLNAKEELVIIRHVYVRYGSKEADVVAFVYENDEALKSLEYEKMIQKNSDKKPETQAV